MTTTMADLRLAVSAGEIVVAGGAEYDGRKPAPLDGDAFFFNCLADLGGDHHHRSAGVAQGGELGSGHWTGADDDDLAPVELEEERKKLPRVVHVESGSRGLRPSVYCPRRGFATRQGGPQEGPEAA